MTVLISEGDKTPYIHLNPIPVYALANRGCLARQIFHVRRALTELTDYRLDSGLGRHCRTFPARAWAAAWAVGAARAGRWAAPR